MRAKTKVHVLETKYIQKDNKNTICILEFRLDYDLNEVLSCRDMDRLSKKWKANFDFRGPVFTVKGISRCMEGDAFDAVLGKRLAESRAKVGMYRIAEDVYKDVADCVEEHLTFYEELSSNCRVVGHKEALHVIDLYNNKKDE